MNVAARARTTYGVHAATLKTPRDLEYDILARITAALSAASRSDKPDAWPALVAALHENRSLWTAFAADLAHPDNGFSPDLRGRLFSLAAFTMKHTDRILDGQADASALIEINTAILRGLRGGVTP